jgi:uncharacterized membrane protein
MEEPQGPDEQLDLTLGRLLRLGVVVSGLVVLAGGVVSLAQHGGEKATFRDFDGGEPPRLKQPSSIVGQAWHGHGRGLVVLGLLLLIATPVARVLFAALGFSRERDWLYVGVSLFVLAVLLWGLFLDS